jgi:hypothetical protein
MKDIAIDINTFDTRVIPSWDPSNIRLSGCYIQLKTENTSGRSIREVILTLTYHQNTQYIDEFAKGSAYGGHDRCDYS